jgi:hypothetical protein
MQMHALIAAHALAYARQKLFLKADKHDQNCLKETDVSSVSFFISYISYNAKNKKPHGSAAS